MNEFNVGDCFIYADDYEGEGTYTYPYVYRVKEISTQEFRYGSLEAEDRTHYGADLEDDGLVHLFFYSGEVKPFDPWEWLSVGNYAQVKFGKMRTKHIIRIDAISEYKYRLEGGPVRVHYTNRYGEQFSLSSASLIPWDGPTEDDRPAPKEFDVTDPSDDKGFAETVDNIVVDMDYVCAEKDYALRMQRREVSRRNNAALLIMRTMIDSSSHDELVEIRLDLHSSMFSTAGDDTVYGYLTGATRVYVKCTTVEFRRKYHWRLMDTLTGYIDNG